MNITRAQVALGMTAFTVPGVAAIGLSRLDAPASDEAGSHLVSTGSLAGGIATMGLGASTLLHGPARAYTLLAGVGLTLGGITGASNDG